VTSGGIPSATYRLQFNRDFTFARAAELVPYLHELGISHCYASPLLKARAGSQHGYDIVDHNALNPEIGDRQDLERLVAALHQYGMGLIMDLVPNHMGVGGDDNAWWLDVLENGPASPYAGYFDIDWHPVKDALRGKVLLPLLGDHYGTVLENGELRLEYAGARGEFSVRYHEHRFPIDPASYPMILDGGPTELLDASAAFAQLPPRSETALDRRQQRLRDKEAHKQRLAQLSRDSTAVSRFIADVVAHFNGAADNFDALHNLLERQAYRLAYWRVAADEINYRRFFDINDLAGLCMEKPEVFAATHRLIFQLLAQGKVDGLRIDHPDGLYHPAAYYQRLQDELRRPLAPAQGDDAAVPCYLVVEKILAEHEYLPEEWPVHGTTGYDFAHLVNGLFVFPAAEHALERIYARFIGRKLDFDELLYDSKQLIIHGRLSSELTVLANLLDKIAEGARRTRDFTLSGLRQALAEVVACFPVYRTYVTREGASAQDRQYIDWAVAQAKERSPAADVSIFDFIHAILLLEGAEQLAPHERAAVVQFAMKFQQYTAPVMAKALEDTACYRYHRLVALNEVGGDPRRFGVSVAAFHHANQERTRRWPHTMLTTSTHDTKRSEDVRARLNVLSEIPDEWRGHLARWSRLNRGRKLKLNGVPAPARNDEYLLYQTLIGAWPLGELDEAGLGAFRQRIAQYMVKAVREAKLHSSWINPNTEYEQAVVQFVERLLHRLEPNPFLGDLLPFQRRVARFGLLNGLSQTLLKLTAPGVPDVYQGNELWDFSLVDPDNRRPVDYPRRQALLHGLKAELTDATSLAVQARALLDTVEDGRAKLYLIWKALMLRREHALVFRDGDYLALEAHGAKAEHLCAFARRHQDITLIAAAPRWLTMLTADSDTMPLGQEAWPDTRLALPDSGDQSAYENVLTGETLHPLPDRQPPSLAAADLFAYFPVALLCNVPGRKTSSP